MTVVPGKSSNISSVDKTRRTQKELDVMVAVQQSFHQFVREFLQEGTDLSKAVVRWQSKETQKQVLGLLKFCTTTKPKRDPNAPVRPRSAYVFFGKAKRDKMKLEYPDKTATQITQLLNAKWATMSDKKKAKYEKMADDDKLRYNEELKTYTPSTSTEPAVPKKRGRPVTKKKREGPKRARTSYILFCSDMRPVVRDNNPEMTGRQITTEMARMWKEDYPSKNDRKKWRKAAKEDKARYEREKEEWEAQKDSEESDVEVEKPKIPEKKTEKTVVEPVEPVAVIEPVAVTNAKKKVRKETKRRKKTTEEEPTPKSPKTPKKQNKKPDKPDTDIRLLEAFADLERERVSRGQIGKWMRTNYGVETAKCRDLLTIAVANGTLVKTKQSFLLGDGVVMPSRSEKVATNLRRKLSNGKILFFKEERSTLQREHPDWSMNEVTKALNKSWKELEKEERQVYQERALSN